MQHDPTVCGCSYKGNDCWSCGHIDNLPTEHDPDCDCRHCSPEPEDEEGRLIHDHSMDA